MSKSKLKSRLLLILAALAGAGTYFLLKGIIPKSEKNNELPDTVYKEAQQ